MKILQIITSLNTGGAEKLIVDSLPLYQSKGIGIDVLTLKDSNSPFRKKLEESSKRKVIGLTTKSVYNPFLIFKIISYLSRYDLVHVHLFPALYWVVLAKWLSFSNTKIVYTEHSTYNKRRENIFFKMFDRLIYRGISKIVTISEEVDRNIKSHLQFKNVKFTLINNGVDISTYSQAIPFDKNDFFSNKDFLLIQVSSFRYPKDQATLIKSLDYLPEHVKLLLVGEGPLKADCEALVNKLNLQSRLKFLGVRTDVPALLKTSDVVVLSSVYEGLSLSSIEGMVSRPFVASNVPGLREITTGYGLLFKQGDSQALAKHILKLYNDKEFYNEVAEKCFERGKEFDINIMVDKYIDIYKELLKNE